MKSILKSLVLLMLITSAVLSGKMLWKNEQDTFRGQKEYADLREYIGISKANTEMPEQTAQPQEGSLKAEELPLIDEEVLKEKNKFYAAWVYIPDTAVNYPVVFPNDNREYLRKTFGGESRPCGSLFFDSFSEPFSGLNSVIHGHNMRSGEMFGGLKKYLEQDYADRHKKLYIFRRGEWKAYRLYSVYRVSNTEPFPYQVVFTSSEAFQDYAEECRERGGIDAEHMASSLLTLSTCYGRKEKLIVQWAEDT